MQKWELHLSDAKIHFKLIFWDCKILSEKLCRSFLCHRADLIQITRLFSVHSSPFWAMLRRTKQAKTNREANRTFTHKAASICTRQGRCPQHIPSGSLGERTTSEGSLSPEHSTTHAEGSTQSLWESLMCLWTPETSWKWGTSRPNKPKEGSSPNTSKHWPFVMSSLAQVAGECFHYLSFLQKKKIPELEASCSNPSKYKTSKFHEK